MTYRPEDDLTTRTSWFLNMKRRQQGRITDVNTPERSLSAHRLCRSGAAKEIACADIASKTSW